MPSFIHGVSVHFVAVHAFRGSMLHGLVYISTVGLNTRD